MATHSLCCVALSELMQDWFRHTALMAVCGCGHLETARLLLHRGALVNHKNMVRVLLLYIAAEVWGGIKPPKLAIKLL